MDKQTNTQTSTEFITIQKSNKKLAKFVTLGILGTLLTIYFLSFGSVALAQSNSPVDTSSVKNIANNSSNITTTNLPPQNINLSITKVVKDGKDYTTDQINSNSYSFRDVLNSGDSIKYTWDNTKIGIYFKSNPAICCGYLV